MDLQGCGTTLEVLIRMMDVLTASVPMCREPVVCTAGSNQWILMTQLVMAPGLSGARRT